MMKAITQHQRDLAEAGRMLAICPQDDKQRAEVIRLVLTLPLDDAAWELCERKDIEPTIPERFYK